MHWKRSCRCPWTFLILSSHSIRQELRVTTNRCWRGAQKNYWRSNCIYSTGWHHHISWAVTIMRRTRIWMWSCSSCYALVLGALTCLRLLCIVSPSFRSSAKCPSVHNLSLLFRALLWSLVFEFLQVFCSKRLGMMIAAFNAIFFSREPLTQAIFLVDAANAFNSVNRKVFLHNINIVCPSISIYVQHCYTLPSRSFIIGGTEIKPSEGTTQGYPVAMPICALSVIPLMLMVFDITYTKTNSDAKMEGYADDFSTAASISSLKHWWDTLCELGPKFGYFPEPTKFWLIVKSDCCNKAIHIFKEKMPTFK